MKLDMNKNVAPRGAHSFTAVLPPHGGAPISERAVALGGDRGRSCTQHATYMKDLLIHALTADMQLM